MRFYVVGLIFIIFDVESALMFPVAAAFRSMADIGRGGIVLVEVLIFLFVLVAGIAYCWSKGDLDWVKSFQLGDQRYDQRARAEEAMLRAKALGADISKDRGDAR